MVSESGLTQDIALVNDLPSRDDIRRILIIKWGGMGDVVISTAIIEDVFRAFPGRDIHLNAMPPWNSLLPTIRDFLGLGGRSAKPRAKRQGMWRWVKTARAGNYDLIIDLQCNDRTRLLLSPTFLGMPDPMENRQQARIPIQHLAPETAGQHARLSAHTRFIARRRDSRQHGATAPVWLEAHRKRASAILDESGLGDGRFAVFLPEATRQAYQTMGEAQLSPACRVAEERRPDQRRAAGRTG